MTALQEPGLPVFVALIESAHCDEHPAKAQSPGKEVDERPQEDHSELDSNSVIYSQYEHQDHNKTPSQSLPQAESVIAEDKDMEEGLDVYHS